MTSWAMTSWLEYHNRVRLSIPASVAGFAVLAFCAVCVSGAPAQVNGVPSSVTSQGFGGRAINGAPPSVTSLGPHGTAPNSHVPFSGPGHGQGSGLAIDDTHRHRRQHDDYPVGYAIGVPYAVDLAPAQDNDQNNDQADDDANYQGGPTVFDRRGAGADSYVPPVKDVPRPHSVASAYADPADETPQPPTTLVFKDGREMEVGNYAIVGDTLFDLTPGHARKVALAELDLERTRQQNEDHGVIFDLPSSPQAN